MVRIGKWKEKKESMLKVFSWLKKNAIQGVVNRTNYIPMAVMESGWHLLLKLLFQ